VPDSFLSETHPKNQEGTGCRLAHRSPKRSPGVTSFLIDEASLAEFLQNPTDSKTVRDHYRLKNQGSDTAMEIRTLQPEDCDKIGPLLREIWLDAYHGIHTDEELLEQSHKVHTPELVAREIDDPNTHSVVAISNGRIIGHARSNLVGDRVDIYRLYVLRAFYGQGIGKALLQEVETFFDAKYEVWTEVYEENKRAVDFYLSQGYEIMERATEVQTEGKDVYEYKMRKIRKNG